MRALFTLAVAAFAAPAVAAPMNQLPGAPIVIGLVRSAAPSALPAQAAHLPALGPALPQAPALGAPAGVDKTAFGGLQAEVARMDEHARSGKADQGGANAAFDGSVAPNAAGSTDDIAELNKAITEVLAPYNDNVTKASIVFNRVETNAKRAVHVDATADYSKKGSASDVSMKVHKFVYAYPDGGEPKTDVKVTLGLDLKKILSQKEINDLGPQADKMVADFARQYADQFGPAATIDARVTRKETDAQGNLTALGLSLGLKVDLSKLPAKVDPKSVDFTDLKIDADITLTGAEVALAVTSNPNSRSFDDRQTGLKELLDGLLKRDKRRLNEIQGYMRSIDWLGTQIANRKPPKNVAKN